MCAASVFLLGDAVGHVHQMLATGNFAPGNAGVPFYMDVICPVVAIILTVLAYRAERSGFVARPASIDTARRRRRSF